MELGEENVLMLVRKDGRKVSGVSERTKVERIDSPFFWLTTLENLD
jgi:hypothetical protein